MSQVAWSLNHKRIGPKEHAKIVQNVDDMFKRDLLDYHLISIDIHTATLATIEGNQKTYNFIITPAGDFGNGVKKYIITTEGDENEAEKFLNEILDKPILLTVDRQETQNIILHRGDKAFSNAIGGVYVFESVKGGAASEGGGGGGAADVGSKRGGKSVRRRSRKRYSRRRRVSNKKYSASRRGRGRGRRSRKN
jgi:hypothetical protein